MSSPELWDKVFSEVDPQSINIYSDFAVEISSLFNGLLKKGATLLEVGCGAGELSGRLSQDGFACTLLDQSDGALSLTRKVFDAHGLSAEFIKGDMFNLPFSDNTFHCVWNSGVLEHYTPEQIVTALREMARVSKMYVVVLVPNTQNLVYRLAKRVLEERGEWEFGTEHPQASMASYFAQAGLACLNETYLAHDLTAHWVYKLGVNDVATLNLVHQEISDARLVAPNTTGYILGSIGRKMATHMGDYESNKMQAWLPVEHVSHSQSVLEQRFRDLKEATSRVFTVGQSVNVDIGEIKQVLLELNKSVLAAKQSNKDLETINNLLLECNSLKQELARSSNHISNVNSEKTHLVDELSRKEAELVSLRQELNFERSRLDELQTSISNKHSEILAANNELDFERVQRQSAQRELHRIYNSKTYRIMTPLWLLKRRLFGSNNSAHTESPVLSPAGERREPGEVQLSDIHNEANAPAIRYTIPTGKGAFVRFGVINWDFRFQRPQQILHALTGSGYMGFYVNASFSSEESEVTQIAPDLYQITLKSRWSLNPYRSKPTFAQSQELAAEMQKIMDEFGVRTAPMIVDLPFWYSVADCLRKRNGWKIVYDMMDDHSGFENNDADMLSLESSLVDTADGVICSSNKLWEKLNSRRQHDIVLIRNACDFEHFNKAAELSLEKKSSKPVVGYYGAIAEWFDPDVIKPLIEAHPDWDFVLAGAVTDDMVRRVLSRFDNVQWVGEVRYDDLPSLLKRFDLCIIPFKINDLTLATNPVKLYEYLAAGKPVLTTPMPEVQLVAEELPDVVTIANNAQEFMLYAAQLIAEQGSLDKVQSRIDFARRNDWSSRSEGVRQFTAGLYKKASIIIVSYGNFHLTKQCLESVYKYTDYPSFEVIVVDNGSSKDEEAALETLAKKLGFKLILLGENRGFAAANNVGVRESDGEYVVLLNNDTVVTTGWLTSLTRVFLDTTVGLACPCTNNIGNEAQIPVTYEGVGEELQAFAFRRYIEQKGVYFDIPVVPLFCGIVRRDIYNQVGGLGEEYEYGMFEDDDFSMKIAHHSGLRTVCSEEAFVHHIGRASFSRLDDSKYQAIFERNKSVWESKWGKWVPHSYRK